MSDIERLIDRSRGMTETATRLHPGDAVALLELCADAIEDLTRERDEARATLDAVIEHAESWYDEQADTPWRLGMSQAAGCVLSLARGEAEG